MKIQFPQNHRLDLTVNYHLIRDCNYHCHGCFATFRDEHSTSPKGLLHKDLMLSLVALLAAHFRKITFAGGEPTLCPWLGELLAVARQHCALTNLVTNGTKLSEEWLAAHGKNLDYLTLSIDSHLPETLRSIGRANRRGEILTHDQILKIAEAARRHGIKLKINTVVCRLNAAENMTALINQLRPERWKILEAMRVRGQNDAHFDEIAPHAGDFDSYVARAAASLSSDVRLVPEPVSAIRGSYAMVDPEGRFFDSTKGLHHYSNPILQIGLTEAFNQVECDKMKFLARGGDADWKAAVRSA